MKRTGLLVVVIMFAMGMVTAAFAADVVPVVIEQPGTQPGEVADDTLFRLAFSDGIAVPICYFLPIYMLSRYTLTRDRLTEIQAELRRE